MEMNREKRNAVLAEQVMKGLSSRNMSGYYVQTKEKALALALSMIPKGCRITKGGSMSVFETGLVDVLRSGEYDFCDRDAATDKSVAEQFAYSADIYLGSVNAITYDGVLVNIDANSNRVSAYAFGPRKLILIVGMNKVVPDVDTGLKRARNEAAPINAQRLGLNTPCTRTGRCMDCKSPDTICCQFLITRYERHKDRVHVILVGEDLGY